MHSFNLGLRVYYNILHLFLVVFLNVPSVFKPKLLFFLDVYFNIKLINIVKPLFVVFFNLFNINHCNITKPQIILLLKVLKSQKCWEDCYFLSLFFLSPPAPGRMLSKTLMFVHVIVLLYPKFEWGMRDI